MTERYRVTPESEILRAAGIEIWRNFLSEEVWERLKVQSLTMENRKAIYKTVHDSNPSDFPSPMDQVERQIRKVYQGVSNNVAILKRYAIDEPSDAFNIHLDPDEFQRGGLFVISLSGKAILSAANFTSGVAIQINCIPNSMVVLPGQTAHMISEPDPNEGPPVDFQNLKLKSSMWTTFETSCPVWSGWGDFRRTFEFV